MHDNWVKGVSVSTMDLVLLAGERGVCGGGGGNFVVSLLGNHGTGVVPRGNTLDPRSLMQTTITSTNQFEKGIDIANLAHFTGQHLSHE